MIFLLLFGLFLILICLCALVFIFLKFLHEKNEFSKILNYLKTLNHTINSVRYGNYTARVIGEYNEFTTLLSSNINDMIESIADREMMIREYIEKEKENNALKSDFIATLTHDLKVPIIAQDNTFELFLNNKFGELSPIQIDVLKKLKISNIDLKHLIDSLLETYKMEQTALKINKEKVKLLDVISDVVSQMQPIFELHDKKINLENRLDCAFECEIDVFLIKRVVQNLILNALAHCENAKCVDLILENSTDEFKIIVKDYGAGIDKEAIPKIFKKYYSTSQKFENAGSGLGLYLSNRIVKLHKGKIEVKSKQNEGSEFTVILKR